MKTSYIAALSENKKIAETLVVPCYLEKKPAKNYCIAKTGLASLDKYINSLYIHKEFTGKTQEMLYCFVDSPTPRTILLVGLGEIKNIKTEDIRETGALITKKLRLIKKTAVTIANSLLSEDHLLTLVEGISLANYQIDTFKTSKSRSQLLTSLNFVTNRKNTSFASKITRILTLAKHVHQVRDIINSPADNIYPESLAQHAKQMSKQYKITCTVLSDRDIVKQKLGLLWAVGKGSAHKPRLIVMQYRGGKRNEAPILLVGKGITFDSGGYNIKPTNYIEEMYMDMAGGAAVMGTITACSELKLPINVVAIVAAAENLVSSDAYKPSDIITAYNGKTVEITNTDAEGRLVLADAISYGIDHYKPQAVIDLATLTGACMVAVGDRYSGVFSNNNDLLNKIKKAATASDELVWELPIHPDYEKRLKSEKADMVNCDVKTRLAGASTAAAFLKKFAGKTPWLHLDIAGTAFGNSPKAYDGHGGTGFGVRLLIEYLSHI
jgi:leucyl aminopeptidase